MDGGEAEGKERGRRQSDRAGEVSLVHQRKRICDTHLSGPLIPAKSPSSKTLLTQAEFGDRGRKHAETAAKTHQARATIQD